MKGTMIQLISKGSEDSHLTITPEFSYFKTVYKRHTNFSMESIETIISSIPTFGSTKKINIIREGELLSKVYLEVNLPYHASSNAVWTNRIGFNLIKKVELIIGDTIIERQYGMWMYIWSELTSNYDKHSMLDHLIGPTSLSGNPSNGLPANIPHKLYIPLNFFFCQDYSLSLPIAAILNQDIYIKIYFEEKINCFQSGDFSQISNNINTRLWIDNIFLERSEELKIVQKNHRYLINIPQFYKKNLETSGVNTINIPFKLWCKELFWVLKKKNVTENTDKFTDFTAGVVQNAPTAKFYQHYNYGGWQTELQEGSYNNTQLLALNSDFNSLSSVLTNGLTVMLYTGPNFDGNKIKLVKDNSGLGIYNDRIQSVRIINEKKDNSLLQEAQIKIDSKNFLSSKNRSYEYFNYILPYKYHSGYPPLGINVFPFCLEPENNNLSGYLNLDNIKKFSLTVKSEKCTIFIFSNSFNFLEIKDNNCILKYKY